MLFISSFLLFFFQPEEVDNVRVAVRCRPMNDTESTNGNKSIVTVDRTKGEIIG